MIRRNTFIILASVMFASSCTDSGSMFADKISEGRINYTVSFPMLEEDNVMMSILPDQMSISFKNNRYNSEFNTYGGVFKNKISIDTEKETYSQMLKIFKKRLACDYDQVELEMLMQDFPPFTIVKSDKLDTLAGIPCKRAKGVFYDLNEPNIDIYYTDRIAVDNPNWCTPFAEIDGFLLGYDVDMFDMRLRLLAENVEEVLVPDDEFVTDPNYKKVSYRYIKVELEKLMESFDL